ncbi:hypothetical protein HOU02_gp146 [Caulobacter phage CcrBL9]|uniref:Uncharacterized protein n=1 Tax=Caulobacter phage CcrBL9 TaxID=2283270 RepID=A0A385EFV7_9CAUD|nr:hypothetical protein HOU02_gp039 [Caulobacter phage CcrBL9]YP_009810209.1 hypothetical protein HOU02_gp146 [Caulobacter phage CcrBL9]AXQ69063.1 hypothetical protein CcrBL9_gp039 [Caulobacter phage CcrBL9]AXQ69579.1 hypothetical protein CcrBL9_gp555 [Caulobacter phage CcrBL9]
MAKQEQLEIALVLLDEHKAKIGAPRAFTYGEVIEAYRDAGALISAEVRLQRIAENECNGYRDETAEKLDERRRQTLEAKAGEIAKRYGVALTFGGDPRGSALKIKTPHTGRYNGFGGREDGWAV